MIVDAVLALLLSVVETIFGWLPEAPTLDLGPISGFAQLIGQIDSLIPILPIVGLAFGMLSALVIFLLIRLVLVVVNIVWW